MKTHRSNLSSRIGLLTAVLLSIGAMAGCAHTPTTLKDAYKDHFYIGVAINRTIAIGTEVQANNVNRTLEQVLKDTALVKAQFNQIVPENDLKWAIIHPREGADGYDFAPADTFVKFGTDNNLYLVGHTLVWHGQTPNWVFQGTGPAPAPAATEANAPAGGRRGRGGITGPLATREELLQRMHDHISTVVGRWQVRRDLVLQGPTREGLPSDGSQDDGRGQCDDRRRPDHLLA